MTVNEAYLYTTDVLAKLSSNAGDKLPKHSFVRHFNAAQLQWVEDRSKVDQTNQIRIDEIQHLATTVSETAVLKDNYYQISLPDNYFHYERSWSTGKCTYSHFPVREKDVSVLLEDEFWKPSSEWAETICTVTGNNLRVYVAPDMQIQKIHLMYYRHPLDINMADGNLDVNGNPTVDVDPELNGASLIEVLTLTARNLAGIFENQFQYQINQGRSTQHT
jgi:hypothetical protein